MNKNQINILILDDDASSREALKEIVKRAGFKSTLADKAESALNAVRIKPIHAAIVDCMLPKKNGVSLVEELRQSRFGQAPVILVSGIFKDRVFAQDATAKTGAIEFLTKPILENDLIRILEENLSSLIDVPKVPLHALLSKPYASDRDRVKALESIEEVKGRDLPLIISILLDSSSAGFLNLITTQGDISGITFQKGKIIKVDADSGSGMVGQLLVKSGFLTTHDREELSEEKRKQDLIRNLINENLMSPHAVHAVKKEQIFYDLEKMIKEDHLQINFVPERIKEDNEGISSVQLTPFYYQVIFNYYSLKWLEDFYLNWIDHPMRKGPEFSPQHEVIMMVEKELGHHFVKLLEKERTIEEILALKEWDQLKLYRFIHLLAIRRVIIFDDAKRSKNSEDQFERLKVILKDIEGKNPFEIFDYFGGGKNPNVKEVERIYKEFARANHPDTLASTAKAELKELVHKVYALVSDAYDILSNEVKREKFVNSMKQKVAEKQLNSERIGEEGLILLKRGQIRSALSKLNEAIRLHPSHVLNTYWCWATLKAYGDKIPPEILKEVQRKMEAIPGEERRTPIYLFVSGLVKKSMNDYEGAQAQFDKALSLDPAFLDVRRELSLLRQPKEGNTDTFTGELTSIVGRLFKRQVKK